MREWQWYTASNAGPRLHQLRETGPDPVNTPRRDGAYDEDNLRQAVGSGRNMMAIETWNELDEGTGILEIREWGRQYIALTRKYVDQFKARP